ncbi:MAG: TonB-dependent receptor, partial [candidate division KSB1 bacterium]|nr:TonB-dependent receptor [candidate division KSB1 bacterium]
MQISKQAQQMMTLPMPEPLQALHTLPGVTAGNDQSSFYNVRGGNYNENLIYINGFEVQQLQLVRKGYMENPSFVNQNMVGKFDLLTGFRPVNYGDKLSSALNIEYIPSQSGLHASADIRTIGFSGALSYKTDDRFFVNLGVRKINYAYLMSTNQLSGTYQPDFQDFQTAARWSPNGTIDIDVLFLNVSSRFKLTPRHWEYKSYYMGDYEMVFITARQCYNFANRTIGARFSYTPIPHVRLMGQYSNQLQRETEISSLDLIVQEYVELENKKEIIHNASLLQLADNVFSGRYQNLKTQVDVDLSGMSIGLGYEGNRYLADQKIAGFETVRYLFYKQTDDLKTANTFQSSTDAYYCQIKGTAFKNLQYYFGLRNLIIPRSSEALLLPRFHLNMTIVDGHHLTASVGRYAQPPFHKEFAKSTVKNTLRTQKAIMGTIGYECYWKKILLKAEGYYKYLNDLVSYDIADVLIDYSGLNDSRGIIYGMDIYARFQQRDNLTHWISYSYLTAREDLNDDGRGFLPMPTDRRHQFAVFTEDYMPKIPNSKMHMRIIYGSGFPYTDYRYEYDEQNNE